MQGGFGSLKASWLLQDSDQLGFWVRQVRSNSLNSGLQAWVPNKVRSIQMGLSNAARIDWQYVEIIAYLNTERHIT